MAAHKRYRNSNARAHIKVQMRSAEIPAYYLSLARYGKSIQNIIRNIKVELNVPVALMGDFNINISDEKNELAEFLAREFKIHHHSNALPTTLGNTCIDHVFLRNMNTECVPHVSYFSYHRPLLNKLAFM
jgi:endonuclease/exonuclease/phosphatase family metal-dependent hydrolase